MLALFLVIAITASMYPMSAVAVVPGKGGFNAPQEKRISKISDKALYANDEIMVRFASSVIGNTTKITTFAEKRHLEKKASLDSGRVAVFRIKDGKSVKKKVEELIADSSVTLVQPNYRYKPLAISTNDTYKTSLWGLDNTGQTVNGTAGTADADIDAPEAWGINEGTNGAITVAVIDEGVAYDHPDLAANMWDGSSCVDANGDSIGGGCLHGYDFENDDTNPLPDSDTHGTFVAGIIAALKNNSKGLIGVAPNAKIMSLKSSLTTEEVVNAIAFAQRNGAKVINASWGGYDDDPILDSAISSFDGMFVAAAGNESVDNDGSDPLYPCALSGNGYDNVICVAATDQNDALADFSNYGASTVDLAAPGVNIFSASAYTNALNEDFQGVTVPGVPATWTKTGNFGTVNESGDKKLVGDTNQSPYLDNVSNTATTASYNTTASRDGHVYVDFDTTCDTEYSPSGWSDYMEIDSSDDGGVSWSLADMRWDESMIDDDSDSAGSVSYEARDTVLGVASSATTKLRFKWITNGSADANHAGCTVNNLKVKYLADGSGETYEWMDGTSMAAPMVAGAVALAWGYRPDVSIDVMKDAIVNQGDAIAGLDGVVASGKRLNVEGTLQYLRSVKTITSIVIHPVWTEPIIDDTAGTVSVAIPSGADLSAITPEIYFSGVSISPASNTVQDFTNPVTYTVTALDGSTKDYVVTVLTASTPTISDFRFDGIVTQAVIDNENHTVAITVPYGTNRATLLPVIYTDIGSSINLAPGFEQDYTDPVDYVLSDSNGFSIYYTVTVTVSAHSFADTGVSFKKGDVSLGKTSNESVRVKFDDVDHVAYYMVSRHEDFAGAEWRAIRDGVRIDVKKKGGKQRFYFRFKDVDGAISDVYTKTVRYVPEKRAIKNSQSQVKRGETLTQSGERFSKDSLVEIYFSVANGSYQKIKTRTDDHGVFSVSFTVGRKPKGKYFWYAFDTKTRKKSQRISYKVVE